MLPGLPAYCLFMLIRYLDNINDDKNVRGLIQVLPLSLWYFP
jgi:hypothetical protein